MRDEPTCTAPRAAPTRSGEPDTTTDCDGFKYERTHKEDLPQMFGDMKNHIAESMRAR